MEILGTEPAGRQGVSVRSRRSLLAALACAVVLTTGCAERPGPGAPPGDEPPYYVQLEPLPEDPPVPSEPLHPDELGMVGEPMPEEMLTFQNRLHEQFGSSPDLGATELEDGPRLIVRWFGEPPAELLALIDSYRDAPFEIRLVPTRFRYGDLIAEARRLLQENPGVVTGTGPRNEGDGVVVGLDPARAPHPDRAVLDSLGITSEFPLFPEAMSQPVPAGIAVPME
jgi:hypothetical protein